MKVPGVLSSVHLDSHGSSSQRTAAVAPAPPPLPLAAETYYAHGENGKITLHREDGGIIASIYSSEGLHTTSVRRLIREKVLLLFRRFLFFGSVFVFFFFSSGNVLNVPCSFSYLSWRLLWAIHVSKSFAKRTE